MISPSRSMYRLNKDGPRIEPWGTPHVTFILVRTRLPHVFKNRLQVQLVKALVKGCLLQYLDI